MTNQSEALVDWQLSMRYESLKAKEVMALQ